MTTQEDLTRSRSTVDVTDEREAHPKFWVAVYTRPRSEKKVAEELEKMGIETYVPLQKQLRFWSDRKKYVEVPVIPMIVFARIQKQDVINIKRHSLILKILTYPGDRVMAPIPDSEIETLMRMLNQTEIPVSFEFGSFKTDDHVVITKGNLKGITGQIRSTDNDSTTLWVSIDLLGGTMIKIKHSDLEKIQQTTRTT